MNMLAVVGTAQGSHVTLPQVGEGVEAHRKGSFLREELGHRTLAKVSTEEKVLLKKPVRDGTVSDGMLGISVDRALLPCTIQEALPKLCSPPPAKAVDPLSNSGILDSKTAPHLTILNSKSPNTLTQLRWWT